MDITMARHNLSRAEQLFRGGVVHQGMNGGQPGIEFAHLFPKMWGAIATAAGEAIIKDATSTELPDTETVTYTPATDGTSPLDDSGRLTASTLQRAGVTYPVWVIPTPRNLVMVVTHGSSIVAMSMKIYGFDEYLEPMTETLAVTATGTSKTATGKKAFKYVWKVEVIAAGNAEANTADLGTGVLIGFPVRVDYAEQVILNMDGVPQTTVTIAVAVTTAASDTTGDVRGTISFNSAPNATRRYSGLFLITDSSEKSATLGVTQG